MFPITQNKFRKCEHLTFNFSTATCSDENNNNVENVK
eukprot:UN28110